jgi:glutamyl-Q tRNA(Asp) synthetase
MPSAPLSFQECTADGAARNMTAHPERWGDVVLVRKDTPTSYHLAVVVDDARQGVTFVTRGMDLFAATDIHRLLQVLLGYPAPLYHHHPLLTDEDGRKLSKSAGDTALRQLRAEGLSPRDLWLMLGFDPALAARPLA